MDTKLPPVSARSLHEWLGLNEPEPAPGRAWVAVDQRTAAHWSAIEVGEAWEWGCLHSRLDALQSLRPYLAWAPDFGLAIQRSLCLGRHQALPPLLDRMIALYRNLEKMRSAVARGELPTVLPLTEEEQLFYWHRPLIRRVVKDDFLRWAQDVDLERTPPWPVRTEAVGGRRRRKTGDVEILELQVVNASLRAMKAVAHAFRQRYRTGGLSTPTREEIGRLLEDLGAGRFNRDLATDIAKFLRPESTPRGPLQAAQERRRHRRLK